MGYYFTILMLGLYGLFPCRKQFVTELTASHNEPLLRHHLVCAHRGHRVTGHRTLERRSIELIEKASTDWAVLSLLLS